MVFSVMRPCAFHLIFWGAGAHPFRLCPISVKIDTLESFMGWKSWLWISKWIFGGASVCFSFSSGADARAKMFGLLQDRYCATYIQHQHSIKVFRCSRWSLWWNCFANWFYLVVCLFTNVDKCWRMLCSLGELNDNQSFFGWEVNLMTPPRKKKHSSRWRLLLRCWTIKTRAEHLPEFSGQPPLTPKFNVDG